MAGLAFLGISLKKTLNIYIFLLFEFSSSTPLWCLPPPPGGSSSNTPTTAAATETRWGTIFKKVIENGDKLAKWTYLGKRLLAGGRPQFVFLVYLSFASSARRCLPKKRERKSRDGHTAVLEADLCLSGSAFLGGNCELAAAAKNGKYKETIPAVH